MSLKLISSEKLNKTIINSYIHSLEIEKEGVYLIEVTASAKSWWQNLLAKFRGGRLKLQIGGELFDQNASKWNGNLLKGLSKTIVYILPLRIGCYYLRFLAENKPYLQEIRIYQVTDNKILFEPATNNHPQDGNCRPWYSFIFYNISLKKFSLTASANKRKGGLFKDDDDDLQLVFNGQRIINKRTNWHKYWYWCGRILHGAEQTFNLESGFRSDLNTIELNADRQPVLKCINIELNKVEEFLSIVKPYKSINGENYNKFDEEIYSVTEHWNDEFAKQKFPPPEPLDPNLVKAIAYKESRLGQNQKAGTDIMQVANEDDPALHTLNNDGWVFPATGEVAREWEWQDGKIEIVDYHGRAKVEKSYDSFYWGVRWIYHKAQGINNKNERFWRSWREAVSGYGPPENQESKYTEKIWDLYTTGIDPHRKNKTYLWTLLMIVFGISTMVWGQITNNDWAYRSEFSQSVENGTVLGESTELSNETSQIEFEKLLKQKMDEALNKYPLEHGKNRDLFQPIVDLANKDDIGYPWVFKKYLSQLVDKTQNLGQFIEAAYPLSIIYDQMWELADLDGDQKKELVFLQFDDLDRNYLILYLLDNDYDNHYQLINYKLSDSYFNSITSRLFAAQPLMLFDINRDFIPEILIFSNKGRMGANLTIFSYNYSATTLEQIFRFDNGTYYPEYILTDQDNDDQLEIIVKNQSRGTEMYVVPLQETFEYNSERGRFELTETVE